MVVGPKAFFARGDEAGASEVGEVSGCGGLWDVQGGHEIADADFAAREDIEDAQARAIGKGAEHEIDLIDFHAKSIFANANIVKVWSWLN